jgi:RES domain-containing protein
LIFEGRVWRHVPAGAHPLDFQYLITASGRWNRRGQYGCLYTALTAEVAIAEYRKLVERRGIRSRRDLVALEVRIDPVFDLVTALSTSETRLTAREGEIDLRIQLRDPRVSGDTEDDLEFCRTIADTARESRHYGILAPSAAIPVGQILAIYPENRPDHIWINLAAPRVKLNYGPDALVDDNDQLRRPAPD